MINRNMLIEKVLRGGRMPSYLFLIQSSVCDKQVQRPGITVNVLHLLVLQRKREVKIGAQRILLV